LHSSVEKIEKWQYKFSFSNKNPVYILWCDEGNCNIPTEINGIMTITDFEGKEETKNASEIVLSSSVLFVE